VPVSVDFRDGIDGTPEKDSSPLIDVRLGLGVGGAPDRPRYRPPREHNVPSLPDPEMTRDILSGAYPYVSGSQPVDHDIPMPRFNLPPSKDPLEDLVDSTAKAIALRALEGLVDMVSPALAGSCNCLSRA
jgi:hypothetical protein